MTEIFYATSGLNAVKKHVANLILQLCFLFLLTIKVTVLYTHQLM